MFFAMNIALNFLMFRHLLVLIKNQLNKQFKIYCLSKIHEPGGGVFLE